MTINRQPIEKRTDNPAYIDVHSIFRTIQGEGPFCGTPCTFVRLAGCNLQCPGCDTDYTKGRQLLTVYQLVEEIREHSYDGLVVITGGEPFRQDLSLLFQSLLALGYYVQVETNGTVKPSRAAYNQSIDDRHGVYLVCSPKTGKLNPAMSWTACAFKYVMNCNDVDPDDGLPTSVLGNGIRVARPPEGWTRPIYLQPLDEGCVCNACQELNRDHTQACIDSCMKHGYTLQLQIHKIIRMQ